MEQGRLQSRGRLPHRLDTAWIPVQDELTPPQHSRSVATQNAMIIHACRMQSDQQNLDKNEASGKRQGPGFLRSERLTTHPRDGNISIRSPSHTTGLVLHTGATGALATGLTTLDHAAPAAADQPHCS